MSNLRAAAPTDAEAIAGIMQTWLDETPWIPNLHTLDETVVFCRNTLIGSCRTVVSGDPVRGFLSLEPDNCIAALYVSPTGQGTGAALLHHAKTLASELTLWVFVANTDAVRFYERHGFVEVRRSDGDNDEGLPDILMGWKR